MTDLEADAALVQRQGMAKLLDDWHPDAVRLVDEDTTIEGIRESNNYKFEKLLFSADTIQEVVEERWESVEGYKIETKFEEQAKEIVRHQLVQLLEDLGIVETEIKLNGTSIEELEERFS